MAPPDHRCSPEDHDLATGCASVACDPETMRALFVGDVVGPRAVEWLALRLSPLRAEHGVDLVIVDAENSAADGASMTVQAVERLLDAGADVITGGNHAFEGAEVNAVLSHERVLRPLNVARSNPGRGALTTHVAGEPVRVVVLADRAALEVAPPTARMTVEPYAAWAALPHGPTHLLPRGTALVTEVGMTAPRDGPQGMNPRRVVERVRSPPSAELPPVGPADGEIVLGAVLLEIADGLTRSVVRLS
jgi:calcineurin-like phosphoesterase